MIDNGVLTYYAGKKEKDKSIAVHAGCGKTESRAISKLNPSSFDDPENAEQKADTDEKETSTESETKREQKTDKDQKETSADVKEETEQKSDTTGSENPVFSAATVSASAGSPLTGDDNSPMLWLILACLSLAALTATGKWKRNDL